MHFFLLTTSIYFLTFVCLLFCSLQHTPYLDPTLNQQIPSNTTIMDSGNVSVGSVGSIPSTETPPPGYMSEDGDPMDQNDNLSELVSSTKC